ncbi:Uncharacterized protein FKW44_016785 [Caligus rogercresseyi]|uniref:DDE-1 domain-containing protein n=1 Tax=Caligus rogercresseyi TaxID=217165 RepID=A0A7T8K0N3_CALRO|nr:Uncharacterized protein FKW44_016785 [Caligus rogercresseyi]
MVKYGLKKTTIHDLLKAKDKIKEAMKEIQASNTEKKGAQVYRKRKFDKGNLDEAVYKWYTQERAEGVPVRGIDIQHAARRRYGVVNKAITGELLSADVDAVEPFIDSFRGHKEDEGLQHYQSTTGTRLACFGSLCPSKKPKALKDYMHKLPVEYQNNPSAWFKQDIVSDWFQNVFDPEVRKHQMNVYGLTKENVKAVLLLDNAPAHPSTAKLCSRDGKIKAMFLPPNTTSLIQPMDQGIIESCKRHYRNLFLQQCLVVTEDGMDEEGYEDTRGKKTLQRFKTYIIKDAIYNWADAWKKVPLSNLRNAWCKILKTPKTPPLPTDFEGFVEHRGQRHSAIEEEEVEDWVSEDPGLPGYHHLTEEEIAEEFTTPEPPADEDDDEEAEAAAPGPSISAEFEATDTLFALADHGVLCMVKNYELLRIMRFELMREVQQRKTQTKISDFFKAGPSPAEKRSRTESETSTYI